MEYVAMLFAAYMVCALGAELKAPLALETLLFRAQPDQTELTPRFEAYTPGLGYGRTRKIWI